MSNFNGNLLPKGGEPDTLRAMLASYTALPFAPTSLAYPVWRNYGRVFGCQMLATEIDRQVIATGVCKQIANGGMSCDEYLFHFATHFYFPSPVFNGYATTGPQIFPICAIIKLLASEFTNKNKPFASINEIADFLKGNAVTGSEPLTFYKSLAATGVTFSTASDELRQVRELLVFVSQFSFLKWESPNLFLDVSLPAQAIAIAAMFTPVFGPRDLNPSKELIKIAAAGPSTQLPTPVSNTQASNIDDDEFTEGKKIRVTHLRVERSAKLKQFYFSSTNDPHICNLCAMDTLKHYPYVARLIELHHVLPLSSPIHTGLTKTSLQDIVGLCPSCHRATHKYYSTWLKSAGQQDFVDRSQAKLVYGEAKSKYIP
ncbi:MAG: HNH endonuclease [Rhodocyclaceae bacterium]|nr:HNH endonuclease [Rhodocyclaceae bacterium]MCA3063563.1 HNH endonuclease [Rhodocyclaceae bacterium]MCA3079318.1 HNH endonuclease [Rhodocyclaceae bacterium]MCA3084265.1 HNH endonuclease [Rhodocyclaceae bacterium]MCA3085199.1 HNH endonuclease [Rhodocyclaceae bacterium]